MGGLSKRKSDKRLDRRVRKYEQFMGPGAKGSKIQTDAWTKPGSRKK